MSFTQFCKVLLKKKKINQSCINEVKQWLHINDSKTATKNFFPLPQVHCNNMLSRGVRVFRQVTCYFRSGSEWEADPVTFRPAVENMSQDAHFVTVPLGGQTARSIKCRFHFSDQWMLFSEVAFQSGKSCWVSP